MKGGDIFYGLMSSEFIQILGHGKYVKKLVGGRRNVVEYFNLTNGRLMTTQSGTISISMQTDDTR